MNDLATLFSTDPLTLSDPDLDKIIEQIRSMRHQFNIQEKAPKAPKLTKKEKETEGITLNLGDLL